MNALSDLFVLNQKGIPVSTFHFKEMALELEEIWRQSHINYHMVIVTLGSKMQHVGTFLFLRAHPEVGLMLSEPSHFVSEKFSENIGSVSRVSLGNVGELEDHIGTRGEFRFDWGTPV